MNPFRHYMFWVLLSASLIPFLVCLVSGDDMQATAIGFGFLSGYFIRDMYPFPWKLRNEGH